MSSLILLTPCSLQQHFCSSQECSSHSHFACLTLFPSLSYLTSAKPSLNLKETWSLLLQMWLKWGKRKAEGIKEGNGNKETSAVPDLFLTSALSLHLYFLSCPFKAAITKCSRGQFLVISFHVVHLFALSETVSFSIPFNNPGKLKTNFLILAFCTCLKAFLTVGMQTCSFTVSCFVQLAIINGAPAANLAYILTPK